MTVKLCLSCSLGLLNRRPRAQSAGCWLSLLHLISIFSGPQTPSGFPRAPSVECSFLYHSRLQLSGTLLATPLARRTQLNYIIVRRPLDLWNRMFNRHQAEITVMQFRGHSLPVYQSMSVPWEFFCSSHFISQFPPTRFPHITAIGMCHFLPVHHLEWHFPDRVMATALLTLWLNGLVLVCVSGSLTVCYLYRNSGKKIVLKFWSVDIYWPIRFVFYSFILEPKYFLLVDFRSDFSRMFCSMFLADWLKI